jgi:hypothetical protein
MGRAIEATTHKNRHPVDYTDNLKWQQKKGESPHAKLAFWPLEASIILYGSTPWGSDI